MTTKTYFLLFILISTDYRASPREFTVEAQGYLNVFN